MVPDELCNIEEIAGGKVTTRRKEAQGETPPSCDALKMLWF
jgi:hypothetical protein